MNMINFARHWISYEDLSVYKNMENNEMVYLVVELGYL